MEGQKRNRIKQEDITYALHLYFTGLSLKNIATALSRFVKRCHFAIGDWIQKYKPNRIYYRKTNIDEFIINETLIRLVLIIFGSGFL